MASAGSSSGSSSSVSNGVSTTPLIANLIKGKIYKVTETQADERTPGTPYVTKTSGMYTGVTPNNQYIKIGGKNIYYKFITAVEETVSSPDDWVYAVVSISSRIVALDEVLNNSNITPLNIIVECTRRIQDFYRGEPYREQAINTIEFATILCNALSRLRSGPLVHGLIVDGGAKRQRRRQTQKQRSKLLRNKRKQSRKQH